ncbi:LAGLIDADG family homing endonuclease [Bacillus sp. REN16]|uniref:LAGLIDADG family homing endonuclease n=1 Tax=Bacillus sp. REN16 TaxID=2887296 RepID=UPI001E6246F1|nr:LAGLIDADG family homing endonuclease [Bacillus sp. REN16]MCC3357358.1 endonuclease [Bacillus sp. REN16]
MSEINRRVKRKRTLEFDEIIKLYKDGNEITEIAKLANVGPRYIRKVLAEHIVELRPFGSWRRQYTLNEPYFKEWSNNMAYILGFILADGCISGATQTVTIAQKEPEILEKIKIELGSNYPLQQNKKTGVYLLNLNSKILKEDLINIHGISQNKSLSVLFPHVPNEYLHHFVRGYFDGDGNIYSRGYLVSFVGGSLDFMEGLKKVLDNKGFEPRIISKGKFFRLYISGRKTIKEFYNWIYKESEIYLNRKYESFPDKDISATELENSKLKYTKAAVRNRKSQFIEIYSLNFSIELTCEEVGISKATYQQWLKKDDEFQLAIVQTQKESENSIL